MRRQDVLPTNKHNLRLQSAGRCIVEAQTLCGSREIPVADVKASWRTLLHG